jgi:hypothetical protein
MPPLILPTPPPQSIVPEHFPMGRLLAVDERDRDYRAREMQAAAIGTPVRRRKQRYFLGPAHRDWRSQGRVSSCTEHALTNKLCGHPIPRPLREIPWQQHELYYEAQKVDEWPGESYEGTSGRAICRAARDRGLVSAWWNAFTVDEVLDLLLADNADWPHTGPVIIGVNWYTDMLDLDEHGFVRVGGHVVGGHEVCLIGANQTTETLFGINSWDSMRLFRLSFADFRRLLEQEDGDAIFPVEVPRPGASISNQPLIENESLLAPERAR